MCFYHRKHKHDNTSGPQNDSQTIVQMKRDKAEAKGSKKTKGNAHGPKIPESTGYSKIVEYKVGTECGWCSGCIHNIGDLLDRWKRNGKTISPMLSSPTTFHESFAELEKCCEKCISCRALRQALLLCQSSSVDHAALIKTEKLTASLLDIKDGPSGVTALGGELWLKISAGEDDSYSTIAHVYCTTSTKLGIDPLERWPLHDQGLIPQINEWIQQCETEHFKPCGQLNWSNKNPTRLIEIMEPSKLRLVEAATKPKKLTYMALSYVWGGRSDSNTTRYNISTRLQSLPMSDLLATQRDAIELARMVGIKYVWIDAICIIQGSDGDFAREAVLMHEYYGNAHFTLCILSNVHADEGFLNYREAWKYGQLTYRINGVRLMNIDTSLDDARSRSRHAARGWTLQEEYLSPRRLYWDQNSVYWCCAVHTQNEGITNTSRRPTECISKESQLMSQFLLAVYQRQKTELQDSWFGIVKSYARRNLTDITDKAKAISGIASQCSLLRDDYLAGLWSDRFAEELVWKLNVASVQRHSQDESAGCIQPPSWSWMSLPVMSELEFQKDFAPAEAFQPPLKTKQTQGMNEMEAHELVQRGNLVTSVTVRGRIRSFWSEKSRAVDWSDIISPTYSSPLVENISFQMFRDEDAHSVNTTNGLLAVSEQHAEEIVAQLDYLEDAIQISQRSLSVDVVEVGQSAMLLLCGTGDGELCYRRIGVCHGVRPGFFDRFPTRVICLY